MHTYMSSLKQASHKHLHNTQLIVIQILSIDSCEWDYGIQYSWQAITYSQSWLATGFAGTNTFIVCIHQGPFKCPCKSLMPDWEPDYDPNWDPNESLISVRCLRENPFGGSSISTTILGLIYTLSCWKLLQKEGFKSVEVLTLMLM